MKKKNIAISFLLLLVAAGIWYYVSLPAFNIHSSGVWYFVLVLVLAVGLVLAGKKGLRYGAIDLKEMKESKGFKWCIRLFILLLVIYLAGTILSSPIVNAKKYQQLLKVEGSSGPCVTFEICESDQMVYQSERWTSCIYPDRYGKSDNGDGKAGAGNEVFD